MVEPERLVRRIALNIRCNQMSVDIDRLVLDNTLCKEIHFGFVCEFGQLERSADDKKRVDICAPIVASQASQGRLPGGIIESGSDLRPVVKIV